MYVTVNNVYNNSKNLPIPASRQSTLKWVGVLDLTPFSTPGPKTWTLAGLRGSDTNTRYGLLPVATPP